MSDKPSREDAPDECQYQGCDCRPEKAVRFRDPKEYVCYCHEHARKVYVEMPDAKYRSQLR